MQSMHFLKDSNIFLKDKFLFLITSGKYDTAYTVPRQKYTKHS